MGMSDRDERELREEKDGITRRDFLDGAAVSAAGLAAAAAFPGLTGAEAMAHGHAGDAPLPPGYYPPTFSDPYTGEPAQVIRRTIKIDGPPPSKPSQIHSTKGGPGIHARVKDTREKYGALDPGWACQCVGLWPPVPSLDPGQVAWVDGLVEAIGPFATA
jgi:hypothetical protein